MANDSISVIAIDYGGVLAHDYCEPYQSQIAKLLGVSIKRTKDLLSEKSDHGSAYRLNKITKSEFWNRVTELAGTKNSVDYDILQLLWAKTYTLDLRVYNLLKNIKDEFGIQLCLITNSDKLRSEYMESTYNLGDVFHYILASWKYHVVKPTSESFTMLKDLVGQSDSPHRILFVDDRDATVQAGIREGLTGYTYNNYNQFSKYVFKKLKQ